jgi:hypothetical protein
MAETVGTAAPLPRCASTSVGVAMSADNEKVASARAGLKVFILVFMLVTDLDAGLSD